MHRSWQKERSSNSTLHAWLDSFVNVAQHNWSQANFLMPRSRGEAMMSRSVGGIVGEAVVRGRAQCMTLYRLFARSFAGATAQENVKDGGDGIPPRNVRSTPLPPPPGPEFSCISTRSVTPRRAYTGSRAPEAPDPLTCCGSGCADCVWIVYGTQLMHYYGDRPLDEALRMIDEQIADVCMREYVKGELRAKARNRTSF